MTTIIIIGLLLTVNQDLIQVYNRVQTYLFGNQKNICRY